MKWLWNQFKKLATFTKILIGIGIIAGIVVVIQTGSIFDALGTTLGFGGGGGAYEVKVRKKQKEIEAIQKKREDQNTKIANTDDEDLGDEFNKNT